MTQFYMNIYMYRQLQQTLAGPIRKNIGDARRWESHEDGLEIVPEKLVQSSPSPSYPVQSGQPVDVPVCVCVANTASQLEL